jgi:hypothetical protein
MSPLEDRLRHLLQSIIMRMGGAIEFWTVACMTRGELGNPQQFIDTQWNALFNEVHELRALLGELPVEPSPVVHEQIAKMARICSDLRDVFDTLLRTTDSDQNEIEIAVTKLSQLWKEIRLRVSLLAATIPLPAPLPGITLEQEAYYQSILDDLFDRFTTVSK